MKKQKNVGREIVPRSKFSFNTTESQNQVAAVATAGTSEEAASAAFGRSTT